jgi:hypothetical protein
MVLYKPGVFSTLYATPVGHDLWEFLNEAENIIRLRTATMLDRPAVEGIEEELLLKFGEEIEHDRTRQMVGHMVRQVMERLGFVVAVQNCKMTHGAPFSRATRYKRHDDATYYAFWSSGNPRSMALTLDKTGSKLPKLPGKSRWEGGKGFRGVLRGRIAFGVQDEAAAKADIASHGFHLYTAPRLLRAAS